MRGPRAPSGDRGQTVFLIDGISAFDSTSQETMLRGLCQAEGGVSALPFVRMFHGERSIYLWEGEGGGEQGNLLMPLLFTLGTTPSSGSSASPHAGRTKRGGEKNQKRVQRTDYLRLLGARWSPTAVKLPDEDAFVFCNSSALASCNSNSRAVLALLGVRRLDTLLGVFISTLHGSEIISVCSQPSLAQRHQLAFRRRLADVKLVDLLRELHSN